MALSIDPPSCQHVTWEVRGVSRLDPARGYFLDSHKIRFADDTYCLRLYPNLEMKGEKCVKISLVKLTSTLPAREVACRVGIRLGEVDFYESKFRDEICIDQGCLKKYKIVCVPGAKLTVLCSMNLLNLSITGSLQSEDSKTPNGEEEQEGLLGEFESFHLLSSTMELLIDSQCQNFIWKVPYFSKLSSEMGYSIESLEFSFAGNKYCLRLYPNGDRNRPDTVLELVRRTSFPVKNVRCKLGFRGFAGSKLEFDRYEVNEFVFWPPSSGSRIMTDRDKYLSDDTLTILCFMHMGEQFSQEARS